MTRFTARGPRRRSPGQALVEFAIILPIIVAVVLGLFDLGRAVFTYNTLDQSSRAGARHAIVDQNESRVRTRALEVAPTIGMTTSNIDVCFKEFGSTLTDCSSSAENCPETGRVIGCVAIVRAHMSFTPLTPVIGTLLGSISMSSTSVQPIEYVCPEGTKTTCP